MCIEAIIMRVSNINNSNPTCKGFNVHIFDSGGHAESMKHFAKATFARIPADINLTMHDVKRNKEK